MVYQIAPSGPGAVVTYQRPVESIASEAGRIRVGVLATSERQVAPASRLSKRSRPLRTSTWRGSDPGKTRSSTPESRVPKGPAEVSRPGAAASGSAKARLETSQARKRLSSFMDISGRGCCLGPEAKHMPMQQIQPAPLKEVLLVGAMCSPIRKGARPPLPALLAAAEPQPRTLPGTAELQLGSVPSAPGAELELGGPRPKGFCAQRCPIDKDGAKEVVHFLRRDLRPEPITPLSRKSSSLARCAVRSERALALHYQPCWSQPNRSQGHPWDRRAPARLCAFGAGSRAGARRSQAQRVLRAAVPHRQRWCQGSSPLP